MYSTLLTVRGVDGAGGDGAGVDGAAGAVVATGAASERVGCGSVIVGSVGATAISGSGGMTACGTGALSSTVFGTAGAGGVGGAGGATMLTVVMVGMAALTTRLSRPL